MSKIGKKTIQIPEGVTALINKAEIVVTGPKGELTVTVPKRLEIVQTDDHLNITRVNETKQTKSDHGSLGATLLNAISGVTSGWSKTLELIGTGYRPRLEAESLVLAIGYSHPVKITPPTGINFTIEENKVIVSGIDRHLVGQVAANIRRVRPPEVYKGKGIKYIDEKVRRKAGKTAKTAA